MKNLLLLITATCSLTTAVAQSSVQYDIRVDGITCPFCVATSEIELKKIAGIELINSNLETGVISVCGTDSLVLEESQLRELFQKKGFTYRNVSKTNNCSLDNKDSEESSHDSKSTTQHGHHDDNHHE